MIDWEQITGLKADLGDGFDELVDVFIAEVDDAIAALDDTATADRIAADLHFLKGASLNLGFTAFAALCSDGEARASRSEAVELEPVRKSYAQSRKVFLEGLRRSDVA